MRQPKDYIIFPLDVPTVDEAKTLIRLLAAHVGFFKVGLELFVAAGPEIVLYILDQGTARVFLDLKLHDIPATVSRAMARVADLGVTLATVHCGESPKMLDAAVSGSRGRVGVLGVTVLTSVSGEDLRGAGLESAYADHIERLVLHRAAMAHRAGCAGVVCSAEEVRAVKAEFGAEFLAVTPGIRPEGGAVARDDQKRIQTPAMAVQNGSDYLVIGRPIRDASDPVQAAEAIAVEIESALDG